MLSGGGYSLPNVHIPLDLTYGMFLYHWIVLNIIVHFDLLNKISSIVVGLLFIVMTIGLSLISGIVGKSISKKLVSRWLA